MIADSHLYTPASPEELIDCLRANPDVLGILRCGSASRPGEKAADLDLCLVVRQRPPGLEAAHFWVGDTPLDMNIRTLEELTSGCVSGAPVLEDVLRCGEILFERSPGALTEIAKSEDSDHPKTPLLDDRLKAEMRFCYAHLVRKLETHVDDEPLLCELLLGGAVHNILETYRIVHGLSNSGEKGTLKTLSQRDPHLLSHLKGSLGNASLGERIEAFRCFADGVVAPVGGLWRKDEVVFIPEPGAKASAPKEWQTYLSGLLDTGSEP